MIREYLGMPGTGKSFLSKKDIENGFSFFPNKNLKKELKKPSIRFYCSLIINFIFLFSINRSYFISNYKRLTKLTLILTLFIYYHNKKEKKTFEQGVLQEIWAIGYRVKDRRYMIRLINFFFKKVDFEENRVEFIYVSIDLNTNLHRLKNRLDGTSFLDKNDLEDSIKIKMIEEGLLYFQLILETLSKKNIHVKKIFNE